MRKTRSPAVGMEQLLVAVNCKISSLRRAAAWALPGKQERILRFHIVPSHCGEATKKEQDFIFMYLTIIHENVQYWNGSHGEYSDHFEDRGTGPPLLLMLSISFAPPPPTAFLD
jgi:hypothetical protein